jgi:hypothetical protein
MTVLLDREKLLNLLRQEDERLEKAQAWHKKRTDEIRVALSVVDDNEKAGAINAVLSMLRDGETQVATLQPSAEQLFTEAGQETRAASENGTSRRGKRRGKHYQTILSVLPAIEGDIITQPLVRTKLQELYPEYGASVQVPTISSTLRQLTDDGVLELVRKGAGGRAHVYRIVA